MEILKNNLFLIAVTFGVFHIAKVAQRKTGLVLLNPVLFSIAAIIIFLQLFDISYEDYEKGGKYIEFWLKPAVVALGVPL